MEYGLLILRLVVGLTLAAHGAQKLFGWFGGHGIAGTGGFFEQLRFRPGKLHAVLAGICEAGGGLLLATGFVTPVGSLMVLTVMAVATLTVHVQKGFFVTEGGIEYTLVLGTVALALAFIGPGIYSLDHALGFAWSGWRIGLGVAATGVLATAGALLSRSAPASVTAKS